MAYVLWRELNVITHGLGERDHLRRDADALRAADAQLMLEVYVGGGEEGVDAAQLRVAHGVVAALDVLLVGARQPGDSHREAAVATLRDLWCHGTR